MKGPEALEQVTLAKRPVCLDHDLPGENDLVQPSAANLADRESDPGEEVLVRPRRVEAEAVRGLCLARCARTSSGAREALEHGPVSTSGRHRHRFDPGRYPGDGDLGDDQLSRSIREKRQRSHNHRQPTTAFPRRTERGQVLGHLLERGGVSQPIREVDHLCAPEGEDRTSVSLDDGPAGKGV